MHAGGAMVMASRPLAPHSVVFVRLRSFKLMGLAQVKHCTEQGLWSYAIGVAFPAPLMSEEIGSGSSSRFARPIARPRAVWKPRTQRQASKIAFPTKTYSPCAPKWDRRFRLSTRRSCLGCAT